MASVVIFFPQIDKNNFSKFFPRLYFIWEIQVLGTYERSAVTSAQTGRRGTSRIKPDTSMLNRNVNKWVYTHGEGTGTCSARSSRLSFLYFTPTAVPTH